MPFLDSTAAVRAGFAALRGNPLRTALSALGVIIGIGAMISVLALSDGVETSIRKQLAVDGRAQTLRIVPRTMDVVDGLLMPRENAPTFGADDARSLGAALGALATVDLARGAQALITVAPGRPARGTGLRGTLLPPPQLRDRPPVAGRFYTADEATAGAHVLVISDALAAALASTLTDSLAGPVRMAATTNLGTREAERARARAAMPTTPQPTAEACRALVGRSVAIRDMPWTIIGILPPPEEATTACTGAPRVPTGPFNAVGRLAAYVPAPAVSDAALVSAAGGPTGPPSETAALVLFANRVEDVPAVRERAEAWLATRYGAASDAGGGWKDRVSVDSYERESQSIREGMLIFRLLMGAITGISLVVGGVGIMNVLLASVTERTREIGISKAVGARRRDVLAQYLAESVAIAGLGAVLGTILGYGVAQIVAAVMRSRATMPVHAGFSLSTLLVAVGAPLVVGLSFGMYPALRAARLSPIDAIRHE